MDKPRARPGEALPTPDLSALAAALEASWDHLTAYRGIVRLGNPAFGQCYPTSRVVQFFYPDFDIARGEVWTGSSERHFWNTRGAGESAARIDLSWKQFPPGSIVQRFEVLDRNALGDREEAKERCKLLLARVRAHLAKARRD
ncbi:hypothetical protein FQV39_29540 [Bosea sp. F3-2]|uniref:YunG family protein n=1 Tax=Bosea sp. F3-2 TaxID=2599640 RepID=UPI0011EBB602|nr:hypothetical protein [Bosea sp. F3-2]QEL26290.1 hypothetical protein FQV39_29540 [Bosea sp. F3-2]